MSSNAKQICLEGFRQQQAPQVTTIEQLHDYVLEEIFSYLNAQELKGATLVCKNWDRVIGSAAVTMKKFKIVIDDAKLHEPFKSSRKHQHIELRRTTGHEPGTSINDKIIISQAKSFISTCDEEGPDNSLGLMQTLELMPLLEDLSVRTLGSSILCYKNVNLPKLKKIQLRGVNAFIIQFLTANNLINVDLRSLRAVISHTICPPTSAHPPSKAELVTNFVMKCKNIKTLAIDARDVEHFLSGNWKDFKLEDFTLFGTTSIANVPSFLANLERFFTSQASTLTTFHPDINGLPAILREGVLSILKYLPKLEFLLFNDDIDNISELARFNSKLLRLNANTISQSLDAGLQMRSLKSLSVECIIDADAWKSIIRSSPELETVRISDVYHEDLEDENINVLLQHPNVKFLEFSGSKTNALRQIFDQINSNYGHLKRLKLYQIKLKKSIKFEFPASPTEWDESEQKKIFEEMFPLDLDLADSDDFYDSDDFDDSDD